MVFRVFNVEFGVKLIITTFYPNFDEFHTQHNMTNCEDLTGRLNATKKLPHVRACGNMHYVRTCGNMQ